VNRDRVAPGWTTELLTRPGTYLVLAVANGDGGLRDPGPVLTLRALGRPGAPEFTASLGEADFTTLRSPGGLGVMPAEARGAYSTPAPFPGWPGGAA
jgi:hypothetical protein